MSAVDLDGLRDKLVRQMTNAAGWAWLDTVEPVARALRDETRNAAALREELQAQRCCTESLLRRNAQLQAELATLRGQVKP